MSECRHEARSQSHTKSTAVNGSEVVSDVRSRRPRLGVRTKDKGFMAMPIEVEQAREGGANVRVFVRNDIAYLTLPYGKFVSWGKGN